jgi:hypothetical protein
VHVILAFDPALTLDALRSSPSDEGVVIDFQVVSDGSRAVSRAIAERGGRWSVEPASHGLVEAEETARRDWVERHARWPRASVSGPHTFIESTRWDRDLLLWWASSASSKDNEVDPLFTHLVWVTRLDAARRNRPFTHCHFAGHDAAAARLFETYCGRYGLAFGSSVTPATPRERGPASLLVSLLYAIGVGLACAAIGRMRGTRARAGSARVTLFSLVPETLTLSAGAPRDRNYAELPAALARLGASTSYLVWQHLSLRGLRRLLAFPRHADVVPLAAYVTLPDLFALVRYAGIALSVARRVGARPISDAMDAGVCPLAEQVRLRVRNSFLGPDVLRNLVLHGAMRRWALRTGSRVLVHAYGTYPMGIVAYAAVKSAAAQVRTVTYQHATYTRWKLWLCHTPAETADMPGPDLYLCQGESYARILRDAGVAPERIVVTGSPRYDRLTGAASGAARAPDPQRSRVLVPGSLSRADTEALVDVTMRVAMARPALHLVYRGHPDLPLASIVTASARRAGFERYEIDAGDLYASLAACDAVMASYSTVADEAAVLGMPVACYAGMAPSLGGFAELSGAPRAHTEDELGALIDTVSRRPQGGQGDPALRERFVREAFFKLDGRGADRAAAAVLGLSGPA